MSQAGILSNLEERSKFHHKTPYTYVANVLIAVNPLQTIPDKVFEVCLLSFYLLSILNSF